MTRRDWFKTMAGGGVGAVLAAESVPRFGRLTVSGWIGHKAATGEELHVWIHGVDITQSCYEADDEQGYVLLYCRDGQGHRDWLKRGAKHLANDGGGVCKLRVEGRVIIAPGPKVTAV